MAIYKRDLVDINLETGNIHRSWLQHSIGYKDQKADHFGIRVFRDGTPVDLTGVSVQGVFLPPQGDPIAITSGNIVSGNVAEVVLPQACYNYDGQFTLAIKLVDSNNNVTGTVRIVDGMVDNTHASGTVAPTSAVPTYQEILSTYDAMIAATAAANGAIAATYSSSSTYAVGAYCIHDGGLYRCTTAITTGEAWTAAHWTAAKIGPDLATEAATRAAADSDLKSELSDTEKSVKWITGAETLHFETGTFQLTSSATKVNVNQRVADSAYQSAMSPCVEGDIFQLNVSGGGVARAWAFADASGNVLTKADIQAVVTNRTVYAPANAAYFVCNNKVINTECYCFKGIAYGQNEVATAVESIHQNRYPFPGAFVRGNMVQGNLIENNGVVFSAFPVVLDSTNNHYKIATGFRAKVVAYDKITGEYVTSGDWVENEIVLNNFFALKLGIRRIESEETGTEIADIADFASKVWLEHGTNDNRFIVPAFKSGRINSDGSVGPDTTKLRTTIFYKLGSEIHISIPNGYQIKVFEYSAPSGPSLLRETRWQTGNAIVKAYHQNFYRFMISNVDETATIDPIEADDFAFESYGFSCVISSTNDNTDRTGEINAILQSYKHIRLTSGVYHISGITMPDDSMIEGDGTCSVLWLDGEDTDDANAITLGSRCTVRNIQLKGRETDYLFSSDDPSADILPSTPGGRNGIYSTGGIEKGIIEGCYIHGFCGAAIRVYHSSHVDSSNYGLLISNNYIEFNSAGIYYQLNTAYNVVDHCTISRCYYGIYEHSGDNIFTGCNLSKCYYGFYFNHDDEYVYNDMKDNVTGCIMGHNEIRAVYLRRTTGRFMFTSCQIGSGGIELIDTAPSIFENCETGGNNFSIAITNTGDTSYPKFLVLFTGWFFGNYSSDNSYIYITNHNRVRFANCYDGYGNIVDPTV